MVLHIFRAFWPFGSHYSKFPDLIDKIDALERQLRPYADDTQSGEEAPLFGDIQDGILLQAFENGSTIVPRSGAVPHDWCCLATRPMVQVVVRSSTSRLLHHRLQVHHSRVSEHLDLHVFHTANVLEAGTRHLKMISRPIWSLFCYCWPWLWPSRPPRWTALGARRC